MSEEKVEKKAWVYFKDSLDNLEFNLNKIAEDGYQVFKIEFLDRVEGTLTFHDAHIVAFNPAHLMKLMQKSQASAMQDMMKQFQGMPGMPQPPGVPK